MGRQKFTIKKDKETKQFRWQVKAGNGEIIGASTESYHNRVDCVKNAIDLGIALNDFAMKNKNK